MSAMTCDHGDLPIPSPHASISIPKNLRDSIPGTVDPFVPADQCHQCKSVVRVLFFRSSAMSAITAIGAFRATPPGLFPTFVANKATFAIRRLGLPCVTPGWPLGHAWATQGPPKPNQQRVAGRFWFRLIAICQLLFAFFGAPIL